jgi:hypothetical protein
LFNPNLRHRAAKVFMTTTATAADRPKLSLPFGRRNPQVRRPLVGLSQQELRRIVLERIG